MTEISFKPAPLSSWSDSATEVYVDGALVLTLYLRLLNFVTQRHYVGLEFYNTPSRSAFRLFRREFTRRVSGFPLEAQIDKTDKTAQRFCLFFGFSRIPQLETEEYFFYERLT